MDIRSDNADNLYKSLIHEVLRTGIQVEARGLKFKEIRWAHAVLTNPRARIVHNPARKLSMKFLIAEFIWMMNGHDDVESISHYNKNIAQFSDNGRILHGAYGPRLRYWPAKDRIPYDQIEGCLERLRKDIYTRQAMIIIMNPGIDFTVPTKDIPCNDLLQFMYRQDALDLAVYVRSNDLNWGFPYDIFHWTMLQELYANCLGVRVGQYHHFVGSLHVYDRDREKMWEVANTGVDHVPMDPMRDKSLDVLHKLDSIERQVRTGEEARISVDPWWIYLLRHLEDE